MKRARQQSAASTDQAETMRLAVPDEIVLTESGQAGVTAAETGAASVITVMVQPLQASL